MPRGSTGVRGTKSTANTRCLRNLSLTSHFLHVSACAISPEEELHWLALRLVPGLGTLGSIRLVEQFRSPVAIFRSSTSDLVAAGLSGATARSISSGCSFDEAVQQQEKLRQFDTKVITLHDPLYPP